MKSIRIIFAIIIWVIFFSYSGYSQVKIPSEEEFVSIIKAGEIAKAVEIFHTVQKNNPEVLIFQRITLNNLGWDLDLEGRLDEAIEVFKLNIEAYPNHYDPYDSYAEALMIKGDIKSALKNYRISAKLNPNNLNATRSITVLENYTKYETMIPMRDGIKLYTQVYMPKDTSRTYPILLLRDMYRIGNYGTPDGYQFFLELGPISNINRKYLQNTNPTWNEYMVHGDYDEYWKKQNILQYLDDIAHPVLNIAAWFDAEDFRGPLSIYSTIEKKNPVNQNILVVGPWRHGGWHRTGTKLGDIQFDQETGVYFIEKIEFPFFNYYLKDKGEFNLTEVQVFETGGNEWRSFEQWPPQEAAEKCLYFHGSAKLSMAKPSDKTNRSFDEYISYPDKPVPWSSHIQNRQGHLWMVEDQRFAARRPDVLVYQSDILTENITIAGPIIASLSVSTTGTDADWIVKLIDVYPSNAPDRMGDYQMLVAGDVFRSKYRNSFEKPEPMVPGHITKIEYDLLDKYHTFLKGHRIMIQVQSTWFPVIDRNPQKFVDIYQAREDDFQKATHRVYRSAKYPSHIRILTMR